MHAKKVSVLGTGDVCGSRHQDNEELERTSSQDIQHDKTDELDADVHLRPTVHSHYSAVFPL